VPLKASFGLYVVGLAVMLAAVTSGQLNAWAAIAVWFGGFALFLLGIAFELRSVQRG
jgi:hypothetical protein